MTTILGLLGLSLLYWSICSFIYKLPSAVNLLLPRIFTVITFQTLVYYGLGYLDPFFLIAVVVSLVASFCICAMLEGARTALVKENLSQQTQRSIAVVSFIASFALMTPLLSEVRQEASFRAMVDQRYMEDAKAKSAYIAEQELHITQDFDLDVDYQKGKHYTATVLVEDKPVALITLDVITLEKKSAILLTPAKQ